MKNIYLNIYKSSLVNLKKAKKNIENNNVIGIPTETVYGLAGIGDLYVSAIGGRNSKMGKYLGDGYNYLEAKKKFMINDTVEGAELAFEIGSKIMKEFSKNDLPLKINLLDSIINNKKFKINW